MKFSKYRHIDNPLILLVVVFFSVVIDNYSKCSSIITPSVAPTKQKMRVKKLTDMSGVKRQLQEKEKTAKGPRTGTLDWDLDLSDCEK